MDLEQAIEQVKNGNINAYEHVIRHCERPLRSWLKDACPAYCDINDIAQRAFITAFERIDHYKPGTKFLSWLNVIARNHLLGEIRTFKRKMKKQERFFEHTVATGIESRIAQMADTEALRADVLKDCISALPEKQSEMLSLRCSGMAINVIADKVKQSISAVTSTLFRIRNALRACVDAKLQSLGEA